MGTWPQTEKRLGAQASTWPFPKAKQPEVVAQDKTNVLFTVS